MQETRVVRVRTSRGGPPYTFGSGYLVAPSLVLTAAHVLRCPGGDGARPGDRCEVLAWGGDADTDWVAGRVEQVDTDLDVAVVTAALGDGLAPVVWGSLAGSTPLRWHAVGYPWAGLTGTEREAEDVWGKVSPITGGHAGRLGLTVDSRRARVQPGEESGWAGLSGAAMFVDDRLVGVVIEDPWGFEGGLTARRVQSLRECPAIFDVIGRPTFDTVDGSPRIDTSWLGRQASAARSEVRERLNLPADGESAGRRWLELLVRTPRTEQPGNDDVPVPIRDVLELPGQRLLLLGDGGAGKTTTLLQVVADMGEKAQVDPSAPRPLFARLNFFDASTSGFAGLLGVVARSVGLTADEVEALWADGSRPCVFVLDGFNEVAPVHRASCEIALNELMQRREHSYVVTSRPGDVAGALAGRLDLERRELVGLSDTQVRDYLAEYGTAGVLDDADDRVRELLRNPFLLWALARSAVAGGTGERTAALGPIYQHLVDDVMIEQRDERKAGEARATRYEFRRVKKPILQDVAIGMCRAGLTRTSEEDLLRPVRDRLRDLRDDLDGLYPIAEYETMPDPPNALELLKEAEQNGVLRRALGTVEWTHESIRDYFAASRLCEWSAADISDVAPRLLWRHVRLGWADMTVTGRFVGPIVMAAGLSRRPLELLTALASRNLMLAALCHAEAPSAAGADLLLDHVRPMLADPSVNRRWVACQCVRLARIRHVDTVGRLVELALHEPDDQVRRAAARALGRVADEHVVERLVDAALDELGDHEGAARYRDPTADVVRELHSAVAVRAAFDAWRTSPDGSPRRQRAQEVLATMAPELVMETLDRLQRESASDRELAGRAEEALATYHRWRGRGITPASRLRWIGARATREFNRALEDMLVEQSSASPEELILLLRSEDVATRVAAAQQLQFRQTAVDQGVCLDAVAAEAHPRAWRPLLDLLRLRAAADGALDAWVDRLTDPRSDVVAVLDPRHATTLTEGRLTEELRRELEDQGVPLDEDSSVRAGGRPGRDEWLVDPRAWGGPHYLNRHVRLRITRDDGSLSVRDVGRRARLAAAGEVFGDPAVPRLSESLRSAPPDEALEEGTSDALAAIDSPASAAALLDALRVRLDSLHEGRRVAGEPPVMPYVVADALARIRHPDAIGLVVDGLRSIEPLPLGGQEPSEADVGAHRWWHRPADALATGLLVAGAEEELAQVVADGLDGQVSPTVGAFVAKCVDRSRPIADEVVVAYARSTGAETRLLAVETLAQHETPARASALVDACLDEDTSEVRRAAARGLRDFDGDEGVFALIAHMAGRFGPRAAEALGRIGDDLAVEPLETALETGPPSLSIAAAVALFRLDPTTSGVAAAALLRIASTGEPAERRVAAETLAELPQGEELLWASAVDALERGDFALALDALGGEVPLLPGNLTCLWYRAHALNGLGRQDDALACLDECLHQLPSLADFLHLRASILKDLGRLAEAVPSIRAGLAESPEDAELWTLLTACYQELSDFRLAADSAERVVALRPEAATGWLDLGLARLANGETAAAAVAYRRAAAQAASMDGGEALAQLEAGADELRDLGVADAAVADVKAAMLTLLTAAISDARARSAEVSDPQG